MRPRASDLRDDDDDERKSHRGAKKKVETRLGKQKQNRENARENARERERERERENAPPLVKRRRGGFDVRFRFSYQTAEEEEEQHKSEF